MGEAIINQPWEDIADDVTSSIQKAVQPLLKKAVDDIYSGLLDTTQDYLCDNLAFNISSRIATADREAAYSRQQLAAAREEIELLQAALREASTPITSAPDSTALVEAGAWAFVEQIANSTYGPCYEAARLLAAHRASTGARP